MGLQHANQCKILSAQMVAALGFGAEKCDGLGQVLHSNIHILQKTHAAVIQHLFGQDVRLKAAVHACPHAEQLRVQLRENRAWSQ